MRSAELTKKRDNSKYVRRVFGFDICGDLVPCRFTCSRWLDGCGGSFFKQPLADDDSKEQILHVILSAW